MKQITVSVSWLVAGMFGLGGAVLVLGSTFGLLWPEAAAVGYIATIWATVAAANARVHCIVSRQLGELFERELAAYHLGKNGGHER